jgi:hypothetical protein
VLPGISRNSRDHERRSHGTAAEIELKYRSFGINACGSPCETDTRRPLNSRPVLRPKLGLLADGRIPEMSYVYVFFTIGNASILSIVGGRFGRLAGGHKEGAMSQDDKSVLSTSKTASS